MERVERPAGEQTNFFQMVAVVTLVRVMGSASFEETLESRLESSSSSDLESGFWQQLNIASLNIVLI